MNENQEKAARFVYHITSRTAWNKALPTGEFSEPSLLAEGFIHFSLDAQMQRTADKFYTGQTDLVVLVVDCEKLPERMIYEEAEPGNFFPHLYRALPVDAVVKVLEFPMGVDGSHSWLAAKMDH
jgi:uncharacterized protein (DUF952 family)